MPIPTPRFDPLEQWCSEPRRRRPVAWRRVATLALVVLGLASCRDLIGPTGGVEAVGFDPAPPTSLTVGETSLLNPMPLGANGALLDVICIEEYESSDTGVLTVTQDGLVEAVGEGSAVLTVRLNTVPTQITIAVGSAGADSLLQLSAPGAAFEAVEGGPNPPAQLIGVASTGASVAGLTSQVVYEEDQPSGWLSIDLSSGTTPVDLELSVDISGLGTGSYSAAITVGGDGAVPAVASVVLDVHPGDHSHTIRLGAGNAGFIAVEGGDDPVPQQVKVTSSGGPVSGLESAVSYGSGEPTGWLAATLGAGTTPASLELSASTAGLGAGVYHAHVLVSGTEAEPATAHVTLIVLAADDRPTLRLGATDVLFQTTEGQGNPAPRTVPVTSDPDDVAGLAVAISHSAGEPAGWLAVELLGPMTPADLGLEADATELGPGTYHATVTVTGTDANPAVLQVTLVVYADDAGPDLELSATDVTFETEPDGGNPGPQTIQVTSGETPVSGLHVHIVYGKAWPTGWLTATLASDTTPADLELSVDMQGIPPGVYHAWVIVSGDGARPAVTRVTVVVYGDGTGTRLELDASDVSFQATEGGEDPPPQSVGVTSDGEPVSGLASSVSYAPGEPTGWLEASLQGGTSPTNLVLSVSITGLEEGTYGATVIVSGDGAHPAVTRVTLVVYGDGTGTRLELDASDVSFQATEGGEDPPPQTVGVTSDGEPVSGLAASISYAPGEPTGWLDAALQGGTSPADLVLSASITGLGEGTYGATVFVSGAGASPAVLAVTLEILPPGSAVIIGLELEVNANILGGGDLLDLDFAQLLSDPVLDVTVWALYSDGTKQDVTTLAVLTTGDPLLTVDGPGVVNLAGVLVQALVDPDHYLHAEYQGFQTDANLRINVPGLGTLPIVGLELQDLAPGSQISVGTNLPQLLALLDDGLGGTAELIVPPAHGEIEWDIRPRLTGNPIVNALINSILVPLGNLVGSLFGVTDGVLTGLNLGVLDPILALTGGVLSVDISAIVDGVVSDVVPIVIAP